MSDDPYASFKDDGIPSNLETVLMTLADELQAAEKAVEEAESALEKAKDLRRDLTDTRIPAATEGMNGKLTLRDGRILEVKEEIRSSIAGDKRVPAINWLDKEGYGNLVKREIVFSFPKGQTERAQAFQKAITNLNMGLVMKENFTVHHATLNSWVKEKLSEGVELPKEVFGIFRQRSAKVKE